MMTLLEVIRRSAIFLEEKGIERPRREAEEVIADVLDIKRIDLYLQFERLLNTSELSALRIAIQRRSKHEPAAYIAGKVSFAGIEVHVTTDVLIPRPETEILVEKIAETLKGLSLKNKILWDMCCGSGCIGLALKKRFPELQLVLADLSEKALHIARQNAKCDATFVQGDLFERLTYQKCDFFVCNPPYVTEVEYPFLTPEVHHEPKLALISGKSGLEFYERIAKELKNYLNPHALAWLEIGASQGPKIKEIFQNEGWHCDYEKDWSGHDRFFKLI